MTSDEEKLEQVIEEPLGDDDIRHYYPNAKILKYSELARYKSIAELLPSHKDFAILLYEDSPNKGHWVCVLRYGRVIEFFDSYGGAPDTQLKWVPCQIRVGLGQGRAHLSRLFDSCPFDVVYNPIKYQNEDSDVNTCGRHCVFRIKNLLQYGRDAEGYYNLMRHMRELSGGDYDEIVAGIIDKV